MVGPNFQSDFEVHLNSTEHVIVNNAVFLQAIVFIVGGGNYIEYQNLVDYLKVCSVLFSVLNIYHIIIDKHSFH